MKQVFNFQEPYYNLRSDTSQFRRENIKTTNYGIQSVKFLRPKIWAMVPQNIKNCKSLQEFKKLIKVWKPKACPCRMCKKYVANIGFIWLNLIKHTPFIRVIVFHWFFFFFFFWLALIRHTYYLVWAIVFLS